MRMRDLILGLIAFLVVAPAFGMIQHPNLERGFSADTAYQIGEIDHVNLFNGGLTLTIPIGSSYPVGGALSYGLTLVYSSKLWDWETLCDDTVAPPASVCQHQPTAGLDFNAGLGWMLHLGRLFPPNTRPRNDSAHWLYLAQDGSEHSFRNALHEGGPVVPGVFYTRDNSYLRLRDLGSRRTVTFPDGTVHTFDSEGYLERIEDPFGNFLRVSRLQGGAQWRLDDGHGSTVQRSHTIDFERSVMDNEQRFVVKRVRLAAFGNQTATYTFDYQQLDLQRPCPFDPTVSSPFIPAMAPRASVQMLRSVTLPDGSNYWMPPTASSPSNDAYFTRPSDGCFKLGTIRKVQLPTMGSIEWDYAGYEFPPGNAFQRPAGLGPNFDVSWLTMAPGVIRRTLRSSGGTAGGTWTYRASDLSTVGPASGGLVPIELRREVTSPAGDKTIHYFAAYQPVHEGGNAKRWDYGLPFSLLKTAVQDGVRIHKSVDVLAGTSGAPQRSTWLRYAHDGGPNDPQIKGANRRVRFERTNHTGGVFASTQMEDFDGLGHYRRVITKGNFRAGSNERREIFTHYNPGSGTFALDEQTQEALPEHTFRMPTPSQPWILNTFDR